ncbi:PspC domain-containing protein [Bacteroidota bacterium]
MKKAIKINLSGSIFHIDDDAYILLKNYLDRVSGYKVKDGSNKEVLEDIESRIAELFKKKITDHYQVISLKDVEEVIKTVGNPSDFDETKDSYYESKWNHHNYRRKRLYRDIDNRTIGGVCSGLSHYFDVDVVIMRIIFVVLVFITVGFILYIVCWIVIPPAESEAERFEMTGGHDNYSRRY